jgi:hypothetical protein
MLAKGWFSERWLEIKEWKWRSSILLITDNKEIGL